MWLVPVALAGQMVAYLLTARWGLRLPWPRSWAVAAARTVVGAGLYWGTYAVTGATFAVCLLVSAPLAWAAASVLDAQRPRRVVRFVVVGTAVSLAVNFAAWGALMGGDFFTGTTLFRISG
jgi:hypothetical protein